MARFIWSTVVAVEAETLEAAEAMHTAIWPDDCAWEEIAPGVEVFSPAGDPDEVIADDDGPDCICPPELVERGGFKGGCPVHSASALLPI
jgi:hypothetical protein